MASARHLNGIDYSEKIILLLLALLITGSTVFEAAITYKFRQTQNPEIYQLSQFPRDIWFRKAIEEKGKGNLEQALQRLQFHLKKNSRDAYAWSLQGDIYKTLNDPKNAYKSYFQALKNNPANAFSFYVNAINTASQISEPLDELNPFIEKGRKFLKNYPDQVRKNIHYTAQSTNVAYGILFAELIGEEEIAAEIAQASLEH